MLALFSLVPPGQIVFASDAPYGHTAVGAALQFRLALQAGLSAEQIRLIGSGQSLRIASREPLEQAGPAVGEREAASHVLLDRVSEFLLLGAIASMRGGAEAATEMLSLARLACEVPDEIDDAPVFAAIASLLDTLSRKYAAGRDPRTAAASTFLILRRDRWRAHRTGPELVAAPGAPGPDYAPRSGAARSRSAGRRPGRSCRGCKARALGQDRRSRSP